MTREKAAKAADPAIPAFTPAGGGRGGGACMVVSHPPLLATADGWLSNPPRRPIRPPVIIPDMTLLLRSDLPRYYTGRVADLVYM